MTAVAADQQGYEVVDLDALTFEQLCEERASVKAEIVEIVAQLDDERRRPVGPEDFGHEWVAYRDWRSRARWALAHRRRELLQIKALLQKTNNARHEERTARLAARPPQETVALSPDEIETRRAESLRLKDVLLQELQHGGDPSVLLLRMYRVVRHALQDHDLPASLDAQDIAALRATAEYLGGRYGRQNVGRFVKDKISEVSA